MGLKGKKFIVDKNKNVFDSFSRAFDGFKSAYMTEYHMVIHCYFAIAIIIPPFALPSNFVSATDVKLTASENNFA